MDIAKKIKQIREAKGMTAKEVISSVDMGAAMYSRIETGKTEPSLSTLEKIAKALGVTLSDFFTPDDKLADVNSYDGSLMEKVKAIEALNEEEKKTVFSIVDAFVGKKKLKDALSGVLTDLNK
ncbi:MAG: helix-turn-helix transcriptional regulator [Bacteroidetes bacterium]|nr:helix-turn-helix transcriptional regulator [Bacteroidota bacterium]